MPSDTPLTRAQKWDLLRMSGAAVVSTVFFAVPMFLSRPDVTRPQVRSVVQVPDAVAPSEPGILLPVSSVSVDTVSVVTSTELAAVTRPVLQKSARAPRRRASAEQVQARARAHAPAAAPFGRKLARLIAGSGRYGIRPFPSVSTSGS
jgi:hypothetical protein